MSTENPSNQDQINQGQGLINNSQGQTNQDQGRTNVTQGETNVRQDQKNVDQQKLNDDQLRLNERQRGINVEQKEVNEAQVKFSDTIEKLLNVFGSLSKGIEYEGKLRKKATRRFVLMGAFLSFLTAMVLTIGILNHSNGQQITECTVAPSHPAPHGTPYNQLSCYERSQISTAAVLNALAQYEHDLVTAARLGQPLPSPHLHVVIPKTN